MRTQLNILLVPIQGEVWTDPKSGELFEFPTPVMVLQNHDKWFPDGSSTTRERIEKLFGGGEYTRLHSSSSMLVMVERTTLL
jgi:hypothetical protein